MSGGFELVIWALLIIASITDLIWGKIFNAITFPFLVAGLLAHFVIGGAEAGKESGLGIGLAFLLFFPLWRLRVLAAADVKLLMAIGAWAGTSFVWQIALTSILVGCLAGGIVLIRRIDWRQGLAKVFSQIKAKRTRGMTRMPFAPAFLCALFVMKISEFYGWRLF